MAANPRKFSEKIALHNQKQAEETAAFEAIMREVSVTTRAAAVPSYQKHLGIAPNLGTYRGGSLPNVNQLSTNSGINLQTALQHLDDMKQGRPNLVDRIHRERARQIRRYQGVDMKRVDCSPYGSPFLSPPPDTSWRRLYRYINGASALSRTNSDSALHTSAMADHVHGHLPTTPPTPRRIVEMVEDGYSWDPKKAPQSRPKSCEVPNINIYPSQEQEASSAVHIPISNNTGSLPDLTVLHFPPPLSTPIDVEEQGSYPPQGSPTSLSPTSHHMGIASPPIHLSQQSPGSRRRHTHGAPSPLVLPGSGAGSPHMRLPIASNVDPSTLRMDPQQRQQYMLYRQLHHGPTPHQLHPQQAPTMGSQPRLHPNVQINSSCSQGQPAMSQYRNNGIEPSCQSPTSPLSQPSYSPSQSPGLPSATGNNSPFAEAYYLQQQHQTNALQHQLEQFHMLQDMPVSTMNSIVTSTSNGCGSYTLPESSLNFSQNNQNDLHGQSGVNQDIMYYQQQPLFDVNNTGQNSVSQQQLNLLQQVHTNHQQQANSKIPDIILTGADETLSRHHDFVKDLGNAITGMPDAFDTDFFSSDDPLRVGLDPIDFDGLQMLTDPNMVADPATEDSFRLDKL